MNLNDAGIIALIILAVTLIYDIAIKPYLIKNRILTTEQLDIIDFACEKAVEYAEQIYKNDPSIDRNALAIDYAFDVVEESGVIPERYIDVIEGMIESYVFKLPKTHDEDGSIAV